MRLTTLDRDRLPKPLALRLRAVGQRASSALDTPQLSVVIVNFCQWKNTARLTQQLRQSEAVRRGAAEIIIVDNHSPKSRIRRKLAALSGVTVVRHRTNAGFAKAVNRGSGRCHGEWVLLLNPDVTVEPGFLDQVLESAQRFPAIDPKAGVIGFQLRNQDGSRQASAGTYPTLLRTLSGVFVPRSRRKCQHQSLTSRQAVPWVTGGCFLVRRDCYEDVGGMDEAFFLYYEDVDFCQRAKAMGWSVWYEPAVQVVHHFPLHTRKVPPSLRLITRHALLTYAKKHWATWQTNLLAATIWLEATAKAMLAKRRHDAESLEAFNQLRELVVDLLHRREGEAATTVHRIAQSLEKIASANDGKTAGR